MKPLVSAILLLLGSSAALAQSVNSTSDQLEANFQKPPNIAKPWVFWTWLMRPDTPGSITRDLEEMKAKDISGFFLYDMGAGGLPGATRKVALGDKAFTLVKTQDFEGQSLIQPLVVQHPWTDPAWQKSVRFAASESKRLGLDFCLTIGIAGRSAPGLEPQYGQQKLIWSTQKMTGPSTFDGDLAKPWGSVSGVVKMPVAYRDVAVVAIPEKDPVALGDVMNLTTKVDAAGHLHWDVPGGQWKVISFGQVPTFSRNHWGYFVDQMSREANDKCWDLTVGALFKTMSPEERSVVKAAFDDSWEGGNGTWTAAFPEEFQKRRGYSLINYLPILAGEKLVDAATTKAVEDDYKQTISDLIVENYYQRTCEKCHENGMTLYAEADGPHLSGSDIVQTAAHVDHAMGEFWMPSPHRSTPASRYLVRDSTTADHLYGRPFSMAESFTSVGPVFEETPFSIKACGDQAFCDGVNRLSIVNYSHSPDVNAEPGDLFFGGTHISRHLTWWNQAPAFFDYLSRCCATLQAGRFAADVVFYIGNGIDKYQPMKMVFPTLGPGYDYDRADIGALLERMSVKDGRIVLPDGLNYRILALPENQPMTLTALQKIAGMIQDGATVVGPPPARQVGLQLDQAPSKEFKDLVDQLWGTHPGVIGEKNTGKGHLYWGKTVRDVLQTQRVAPDFEYSGLSSHGEVDWIHRTTGNAEIYYVTSRWLSPEKLDCTFRVSGLQPELWDPVSGKCRAATAYTQKDGRTTLPLEFDPCGSIFVVFRKSIPTTQQGTTVRNYPTEQVGAELTGSWTVTFDPKWGGPTNPVIFDTLTDWTKRPEEGIKYFSGTALYKKRFDLPAPVAPSGRLLLDLGEVHEVSAVKLNGKNLGVVWSKPARIDITDAVKPTENELEITVVNLWPNRLIGDAFLTPEKQFTKTNLHHFTKATPLYSSGLLGPVTFITTMPPTAGEPTP